MFAAVYGELATNPWLNPAVASSDAYSLFVARSSAMGWLTPASENATGGFWGMNDAGQDPSFDPELGSRIAWFQVSITEPVPAGRPVPLQPFFSCAHDVLARMGEFRLTAVDALFPMPVAPPAIGAVATLLEDSGWFADHHPGSVTPLRVTLDSGSEAAIGSHAPGILQWVREVRQSAFVCESMLESGPHRVILHGTLAEWSLGALGWLAAFLADASARCGINVPLHFTAACSTRPAAG
ncbi:hypothetical protein SAMN05421869_13930 [Nonomuraea jiangxiensis]|uniref:Uncharacterized protein n=2 Tax=Nonomuraea jiangxiensis TaxID=633440 RepID=A0A1G9RS37_9ACTN|nr:hypothetical protein SAMN05421869_13930 [Nonomuraea jiangxiensis]